jgi:hypothetical protein
MGSKIQGAAVRANMPTNFLNELKKLAPSFGTGTNLMSMEE